MQIGEKEPKEDRKRNLKVLCHSHITNVCADNCDQLRLLSSIPQTMSDFPDLSSEFATAPSSAIDGSIDFDRASSAFPDISLDGEGDIPNTTNTYSNPQATLGGGFDFDDFSSPPPNLGGRVTDVKVTGDDEIEKFEDQFPELDIPGAQVCTLYHFV